MADDWLSLREAAARTGLSASHLRLLARQDKIKAIRIGTYWATTEAAVRAHLADERLRKKDPYKRKRIGSQE